MDRKGISAVTFTMLLCTAVVVATLLLMEYGRSSRERYNREQEAREALIAFEEQQQVSRP